MKIITASIELTHKCNFNCKHCSINAGKELQNELKSEEIKNILDQLKKLNAKKIELTGGEPLLRKDLGEIIKYAKNLNFKVKILTNGYLLSKEILNRFENLGLDGIAISLDGITYNTYKKIRLVHKKVFDKVIKNIKLAGSSKLFTKINTVIMKDNLNEIQEIIDFCNKYKLRELRICFFTKKGRGKKLDQCVDSKKWIEFIKKLKTESTKVYVGFSYAPLKGGCLLNEEIPLYISSNGNVFSCPLLDPIGNIRKINLRNILKNKENIKSCIENKKLNGFNSICPLRKFDITKIK